LPPLLQKPKYLLSREERKNGKEILVGMIRRCTKDLQESEYQPPGATVRTLVSYFAQLRLAVTQARAMLIQANARESYWRDLTRWFEDEPRVMPLLRKYVDEWEVGHYYGQQSSLTALEAKQELLDEVPPTKKRFEGSPLERLHQNQLVMAENLQKSMAALKRDSQAQAAEMAELVRASRRHRPQSEKTPEEEVVTGRQPEIVALKRVIKTESSGEGENSGVTKKSGGNTGGRREPPSGGKKALQPPAP
jgi:hypothetical protein